MADDTTEVTVTVEAPTPDSQADGNPTPPGPSPSTDMATIAQLAAAVGAIGERMANVETMATDAKAQAEANLSRMNELMARTETLLSRLETVEATMKEDERVGAVEEIEVPPMAEVVTEAPVKPHGAFYKILMG